MVLVVLGLGVIAGWAFRIEPLKSVLPNLSTMKLNTAICFMLAGFALAASPSPIASLRHAATFAGAMILVVGLLTVAEYSSGRDLGIDQLFVADTGTLRGSGFPGRMSPLTATAWIALGSTIMLLALGRQRRTIIFAHILVGYVGFIAFLAAAGYAFGAETLWGIGFYTAMAIHTAFGLVLTFIAALITRADEGWLAPFRDSPDARRLLAGLLPISVLLPVALGLLLLFGSSLGAYNAAFGFALFAPCTVLAFVAVAMGVARRARDSELSLRQSETALRGSEERLSTALAIAQLGTFEWHLQSDGLVLDERSREIFDFAEGEGATADELFAKVHPMDLQRLLAEFRRSRDALSHLETEYQIRLRDGEHRTVASFTDTEGDGVAVRVFGVVGDISDRKRLEADLRGLNENLEERVRERTAELERVYEQLRQAQKLEAMGQLTGGVAHDFNNLLSPIIGSLDLIQKRKLDEDRTNRLLDGALAAAERARVLVQRLLAFARRQPLQPAPVDMAALVDGMAELVASTSGPRIKVVTDVSPDLPPAHADANQLEMAILNLAVNARDAMPDGGQLTLGVRAVDLGSDQESRLRPGRYVCLSVADTGVGMNEDTLARSIEPFFSTKGVGQGTGLGLSMAHGLAAQLGGELQLRSKPGVGTVVELWLPAVAHNEASEAKPPPKEPSPATGTVLLVDDEIAVRISTAEMLNDLGYEVVEVDCAEDALGRISEGLAPDIVVTDHLMPGMTGADFARWLNANQPELPVLIISGYADVDDIAPDLSRLAKPFRQADLAAALARATDGVAREA
jgi:signal transduction histidine kinase/CheY-like chemotaxis protein